MIEAYSNMWWGILAALLIVAATFVIIAVVYEGKKRFTPINWIIGVALLVFLSFEMTYLIGAIRFKMDCKETAELLNDILPTTSLAEQSGEISESIRNLGEEIPLVKDILDADAIGDKLARGITGDALLENVNSKLNGYIAKKTIWSLVGIAVTVILVIMTMENSRLRRTGYRRRSEMASDGRRNVRRR